MFTMSWLFVFLLASFATVIQALPQQTTSIDPTDPNKADPTSMPEQNFTLPDSSDPELFPNGIPTLPKSCDSYNLTADCITALDNMGEGAYLWFEDNHGNLILI